MSNMDCSHQEFHWTCRPSDQSHRPHRGSDVEAWLKTRRDMYPPRGTGWSLLDTILDDYRLRADYGKGLLDSTEGLQ